MRGPSLSLITFKIIQYAQPNQYLRISVLSTKFGFSRRRLLDVFCVFVGCGLCDKVSRGYNWVGYSGFNNNNNVNYHNCLTHLTQSMLVLFSGYPKDTPWTMNEIKENYKKSKHRRLYDVLCVFTGACIIYKVDPNIYCKNY